MFSMQPDLGLVWKFKNIEVFQEFNVKNILVKLQHNASKFWGVIKFTRKVAWPWAILKVRKGCREINIKLGWNSVKEIPVKQQHGTWNFWGVIAFTSHLTDDNIKSLKRSHIKLGWNSNEENITTCKVTTWCRHILRHYHIHKELQDADIWTWCSSKGQKSQPKVNIKLVRDFDVENISVKLWNDTGYFCRVIVFTRQLDLELVWKFKMVTQRSISNSSLILMCRILLSSYNLIQAIYEELSRSQGPPRCCMLESFKKGHTKVKIKLGWNSDEQNITPCTVTTWCRQILMLYHIHKKLQDAAIWTWPISKGQKGHHRTRPRFRHV